jgi:hypothetical protein
LGVVSRRFGFSSSAGGKSNCEGIDATSAWLDRTVFESRLFGPRSVGARSFGRHFNLPALRSVASQRASAADAAHAFAHAALDRAARDGPPTVTQLKGL